MNTMIPSELDDADLREIQRLATAQERPRVKEVLKWIVSFSNDGGSLHLAGEEEFSPNRAAQILRMSRTHLNKLLDRGEIPFHRVGTHRRIKASDLADFQKRRSEAKLTLAEKFAHKDELINSLDDAIADQL